MPVATIYLANIIDYIIVNIIELDMCFTKANLIWLILLIWFRKVSLWFAWSGSTIWDSL